ncbi:hypothetical protein HK446_027 [Escherichia phage HK446]|uniref:Uncharacterized protein n=1 Tax=Escherichia phage HK446 TaxID=1147145 RepID=K7P858_9CAUD|nr:hypothetical protein [Escherichia coli]YP_007111980.1 hypothetical protein F846_gp27 [Escherichia phage HK446]AFH20655.1 hypothetical protein HK446_027 [Escherichia phage HK446]MBW7431543.1 hypothetical protein [Escherichia coli]
MKQMTLIEMDGFLKGKCIPRDLKVNETNAEYLARKFGELESKLETALRECRSAGITIDNLEAKCTSLAAENAGMKSNGRELLSEACKVYEKFNATISSDSGDFIDGQTLHEFQFVLDVETPATDAFLAEVRAQERTDFIGRIEWIIRNECNPDKTETILNELQSFSDQLRKGGNQ